MFDASAPSEGNENIATSTLSFTDDAGHPPTSGRNFDIHVRPNAKAFPHFVTIGWNLSEPRVRRDDNEPLRSEGRPVRGWVRRFGNSA